MRRPIALLGIFGLAAVLPSPAVAQGSPPLSCFATSGPPSIRAEGVAELVGDIVIQCTGGPPTPQGEPLPKQAIEARYSLPVSNPSLTSDLTSALLTIDEPKVSDLAPDCSDRRAKVAAFCRASLLWPQSGVGLGVTYGDGAANMAFGRRSGTHALLWQGVPFDPPKAGGARTIRISNVRVNADSQPRGGVDNPDPATLGAVSAVVSICPTGGGPCPLPPTPVPVASTLREPISFHASSLAVRHCESQSTLSEQMFSMRYREHFATAFKVRARPQPSALGERRTTESGVWSAEPDLRDVLPRAPWGTRVGAKLTGIPPNVNVYLSTINVPRAPGEPPRAAMIVNPAGELAPVTPQLSRVINGVTIPFIRLDRANPSATYEIVGANADALEEIEILGGVEYTSGGTIQTSPPEATILADLYAGTAAECAVPETLPLGISDAERARMAQGQCRYRAAHGFPLLGGDPSWSFGAGYLTTAPVESVLPANRFAIGTIHGCGGDPRNDLIQLNNNAELVLNVQQGGNYPPAVNILHHSTRGPVGNVALEVLGETVSQLTPEGAAITSNWLTAEINGTSAPTTTRLSVNAAGRAPGAYLGRMTLRAPSGGDLGVNVRLNVTPPGPYFEASGVVHAASYLGGVVAPGEAIVIFGSRFGPPTLAALALGPDGRVATEIGQTRVLFDGRPAPMIYALQGQISAFAPFALAGKASTSIEVEHRGVKSRAVVVPVLPTAPAIFTQNQSGGGAGAILNQDNTVNTAERRAKAGDIVQIFGSGGGQTEPGGEDGRLAAGSLPTFVAPVTAVIDGREAEALYAGPAPGLVEGVFQVNVRIPPQTEPGDDAPVVLRFGSRTTQLGVTLSVE